MRIAVAAGQRRKVSHTMPDWCLVRALYDELGFKPIPVYAGVAMAEALCYVRYIGTARA